MAKLRFRCFIVLGGFIVLFAGCNQIVTTQQSFTPKITDAYWPTQAWQTSSPEEQGMDSKTLADMLKVIKNEQHEIDSISIIRNGTLVLDTAIYPYDQDTKHIIHSCTKSIVSILIGIAIERGDIEDVQTPVLDIFPDRTVENIDADKEKMTLENLLTMTTGFRCRDSYLYRWSGLKQMRNSKDWVQFVLDLPMAETPGTSFEYCNGGSFLLSAIITETTGLSALEFAREHLFNPLGINDVTWPANFQGINIGWGELRMRPHDLAKIGYLFLRGGQWDGEQIVPTSWVEASTRKHVPATLEDGYGYQWWVDDSGYYMALGYAGQFVFVLPEKDMVVVFLSDLSERDFYIPQELLGDFIIPAARSIDPLPFDPVSESELQQLIEELASQ